MKKQTTKKNREKPHTILEGTLRMGRGGVGYVSTSAIEGEIEIDAPHLNTGLHGDRVKVLLRPVRDSGHDSRPASNGTHPHANKPQTGEILEVLTRAKTDFVCTMREEKGVYFCDPLDPKMYREFIIPESNLRGAKPKDKAFVRLTSWSDPTKNPLGDVLKVIGAAGVHETEMRAIVLEKGFHLSFPKEVLAEAAEIKKNAASLFLSQEKIRRDLRHLAVFTIDPKDAKDFDDALSIRKLENGNFEVGIHIADPSFYIKRGGAIDTEAAKRATSVYLVDRTIPMLPEVLSNDLSSLNPDEDKLAFSVVLEIDKNAAVKKRWFGRSLIRSTKRFSYEEAQVVLDTREGALKQELADLNTLSKKLAKKREEAGAISFEQQEAVFVLDKNGKPIEIHTKPRLDANKLIEHFMILANIEVATFMASQNKRIAESFIYRVHAIPDKDKMRGIINLMSTLGYKGKYPSSHKPQRKGGDTSEWTTKDVNELLKSVTGEEYEHVIQFATIRAMAKAIYSTKNIGHFGLSLAYYTHFTSPIRRYPDMMVHRMLGAVLAKRSISDEELETHEALARYASTQEVAANEAEWASEKFKHAEYLAEHIGEVYDGTITGLMEKGIFVRIDKTQGEGMVRLRDITDDYYQLDESSFSIVGQRKKRRFTLGDKVRIRVKRVNIEKRLVDFEFV